MSNTTKSPHIRRGNRLTSGRARQDQKRGPAPPRRIGMRRTSPSHPPQTLLERTQARLPRRKPQPKPSKAQAVTASLKKLAPGGRSKPKPGRAGRKASASGAVVLAGAGVGALAAARRRRAAGEQSQPATPTGSAQPPPSEPDAV